MVNSLKSIEYERDEIQTNNNNNNNKKAFLWEDQLLSGCVVTEKFINTRISWRQLQLDVQVNNRGLIVIETFLYFTPYSLCRIELDSESECF